MMIAIPPTRGSLVNVLPLSLYNPGLDSVEIKWGKVCKAITVDRAVRANADPPMIAVSASIEDRVI